MDAERCTLCSRPHLLQQVHGLLFCSGRAAHRAASEVQPRAEHFRARSKPRKGRTIWCVRTIPIFTSAEDLRRRLRPCHADALCLTWAWFAPVITLNSVVFPAPLGPMKPQISCRATPKLTSLALANAAKLLAQAFDCKNFQDDLLKIFRNSPHQTVRLQQSNQNQ